MGFKEAAEFSTDEKKFIGGGNFNWRKLIGIQVESVFALDKAAGPWRLLRETRKTLGKNYIGNL